MSVVTGIVLQIGPSEEYQEINADYVYDNITKINKWINQERLYGNLENVSRHFGGGKHPQIELFGAGFNHFAGDEYDFAQFVLSLKWNQPDHMILLLTPEEGPTKVYKLKDE